MSYGQRQFLTPDFIESLISKCIRELKKSVSWKRRQNLRLLITWLKVVVKEEHPLYKFEEEIYNKFDEKLAKAVNFPFEFMLVHAFQINFAIEIVNEFEKLHLSVEDERESGYRLSRFRHESTLPYPKLYINKSIEYIIHWYDYRKHVDEKLKQGLMLKQILLEYYFIDKEPEWFDKEELKDRSEFY